MVMIKKHGNSNENDKIHHLYEIRDSFDDSIFKFGISHDSIDENGLSNRMKQQITFLNLGVNENRFFARILVRDIPNRKEAREIERTYIQNYKYIFGVRPRGNLED